MHTMHTMYHLVRRIYKAFVTNNHLMALETVASGDIAPRLPHDVLSEVAIHLSLEDAISFGMSCKVAHDIVRPRIDMVHRNMESKARRWDYGPPCPVHPARSVDREQYALVNVAEWAHTCFEKEHAERCFDASERGYLQLLVNGGRAQLDETIRKLKQWISCDAIVCLCVGIMEYRQPIVDDYRTSLGDEHLAVFHRARHVTLNMCDRVTDDSIAQFSSMEYLSVSECSGITGRCFVNLVTMHDLRFICWFFTSPEVPPLGLLQGKLLTRYVQCGALNMYIIVSGPTHEFLESWKFGEKCLAFW